MYDIRQFRPTLYLLLGLGFTGFAIATISPLLWVVSMALLFLNGWLLKHDHFAPLPRWAANLLTLAAAVYTAMRIYNDPRPIFPIGNFLVILQIIKLYEQRGNRDFAQLLVLSLLLMVAAAISTASLIFGIDFIVYLLISPYACLLFHLKVETDHAKRQMGLDERQADPLTLRQDQRYLNRSMTRLTGAVGTTAIVMAVIVFLFFPRVPGSGLLAWQFRPAMAATGMSEQMNMQSVTRVQQNTTQIGSVSVTHNGDPVTGGELYLRGTVYDVYDGDPNSPTRWSWQRASQSIPLALPTVRAGSEEPLLHNLSDQPGHDTWVQEFTPLQPTGVSFLLALGGVTHIGVDRPTKLGYLPSDSLIQLAEPMYRAMYYRVVSTGVVPYERLRLRPQQADVLEAITDVATAMGIDPVDPAAPPVKNIIAPEIGEYARKPEVSGVDEEGKSLAAQLKPAVDDDPPPLTEKVAENIERHLQTQFTYTLDLADKRPKDDNQDPVVHFLYESKTGWCEHYAYAMTLMCQSLGMKARLVSGYKVDEFNPMGGFFIIRQSHAHAWVEVLVRDGKDRVWERFDPTSGISGDAASKTPSAWTKVSHFFGYLEHAWANSVVAYDASAQNGLLDKAESNLVNASIRASAAVHSTSGPSDMLSSLADSFNQLKYTISETIIIVLLGAMILIALGLTGWYVVQRFRLSRRARRIGLESLSGSEARRLARQLGFYDELTRILERRDIVRSPHLTPLEFGQSLSFLPQESYQTIVRLTRIFYRIRFGQAKLSAGQRRSLARVIDRLQEQLLPSRRG